MIRLTNTTSDLISLITAQNGAKVFACYNDRTSASYGPGANQPTTISSSTTTTIVSTPAASTVREVDFINIKNTFAGAHTMTLQASISGTLYPLNTFTLQQDESIAFSHADLFKALTASGGVKIGGVSGPGSSTDNAVARWDGATGTVIQNSAVIIDDSNNVSGVANFTNTGNTTLGDAAADSLTINAGVFSAPNIPCFSAYNSVTDTNQTGNGATATVQFDTEAYDQGNNFSANTFTAPVTGKYFLSATVRLGSLTAAMTDIVCQIVTTARTYSNDWNITPVAAGGAYSCIVTCQADMAATDTAVVKVTVANGAGNTVSIVGSTTQLTFFCGHQIA